MALALLLTVLAVAGCSSGPGPGVQITGSLPPGSGTVTAGGNGRPGGNATPGTTTVGRPDTTAPGQPGTTCVRTTTIPGSPAGSDLDCRPGSTTTPATRPTTATVTCRSVPTTGTIPGQPLDPGGGVSCDLLPGVDAEPHGTIDGRVVAGPTCPVERPDQPCRDRLVPATVTITGDGSAYTVTTDTGRFIIDLPMGSWTFTASSAQAMACPPVSEPVQGATTKKVTITCDTGIR